MIDEIRSHFPWFQENKIIYLDNAATTQVPSEVIERMGRFYSAEKSNIHRSSYRAADNATEKYEHARSTVASFVGAKSEQIAFTQNATDSLNQAVYLASRMCFRKGKNVITTPIEHHSLLLPLREACTRCEMEIRMLPLNEYGDPDIAELRNLMDDDTVCIAMSLGSNSTGWQPCDAFLMDLPEEIVVILDATQRVVHEKIDFSKLDCDLLCFSGHKLYGPTGIGVLCMREDIANHGIVRMGGGMVSFVDAKGYLRISGARGLEAGTPPIAEALGLEAAIGFLNGYNRAELLTWERDMYKHLRKGLSEIEGIRIVGANTEEHLPLAAFYAENLHATDMNRILSMRGFALRDGKHCAHMYHDLLEIPGTIRASFAMYNTKSEVDALLNTVEDIMRKWNRIK